VYLTAARVALGGGDRIPNAAHGGQRTALGQRLGPDDLGFVVLPGGDRQEHCLYMGQGGGQLIVEVWGEATLDGHDDGVLPVGRGSG
jgi:hypothetical protein